MSKQISGYMMLYLALLFKCTALARQSDVEPKLQ